VERIAPVGYVNPSLQHAVVSIYHPALLNPGADFVQVVISIDGATKLRDSLDEFLRLHMTGIGAPPGHLPSGACSG
jgi:hypothetical protein